MRFVLYTMDIPCYDQSGVYNTRVTIDDIARQIMPGRSIPKTVSLPEKILELGLTRADQVREGNFSGFLADLIESEQTSVRLATESFQRLSERAARFKMTPAQYMSILIDEDYMRDEDTKTLVGELPGEYGKKQGRPRPAKRREERR